MGEDCQWPPARALAESGRALSHRQRACAWRRRPFRARRRPRILGRRGAARRRRCVRARWSESAQLHAPRSSDAGRTAILAILTCSNTLPPPSLGVPRAAPLQARRTSTPPRRALTEPPSRPPPTKDRAPRRAASSPEQGCVKIFPQSHPRFSLVRRSRCAGGGRAVVTTCGRCFDAGPLTDHQSPRRQARLGAAGLARRPAEADAAAARGVPVALVRRELLRPSCPGPLQDRPLLEQEQAQLVLALP
jgi:hypothetical protein